ncbi:hypothetical protein BD311DRAFT_766107 [Dichomitus squalens]|uniref:Uncharacterized protein n=1 Tax=Dichomitus squalens TaxID=114155 RepID=A0A4Q9MDH4_9APHY|nr:hypothetical protein BD311DRAFT_766107 [Dichomitus squalens]
MAHRGRSEEQRTTGHPVRRGRAWFRNFRVLAGAHRIFCLRMCVSITAIRILSVHAFRATGPPSAGK